MSTPWYDRVPIEWDLAGFMLAATAAVVALVAMLIFALPIEQQRGDDGCLISERKPSASFTFHETARLCDEETP